MEKTINEIAIEVKEQFTAEIEKAKINSVTKEDYEAFKSEIQSKLEQVELLENEKNEIHRKHAELLDILEKQGVEISRLKFNSESLTEKEKVKFTNLSKRDQVRFMLKKAVETKHFKTFKAQNFTTNTEMITPKAVIGLDSNHTGDVFVSELSDKVRDIPRMQPHMRDVITVRQTDEQTIKFPEITDYTDIYTLGTQMLDENEAIADVTFSSQEVSSDVVRMGVSMSISERYFKGKSNVIAEHVIEQIANAMLMKEDIQILNGDGNGANLEGILKNARTFDLTPQTYTAGAISSVASYDGGAKALITFADAHGLLSGDKLTIANATEATYNATHSDIILIDETKVVINLAYVAEADTSAWTGTGLSYWYQSKENVQELDVLFAVKGVLEAGLYSADTLILNPNTLYRSQSLKDTTGQYIDYEKIENMLGVRVILMPTVPAGWFLMGDFSPKSIEIAEYTPMRVQFLSDVSTKRTNSIVVLVDEEIHLVKYNPKWYIYDRFTTAKTDMETP